jgi:hypothetical protein
MKTKKNKKQQKIFGVSIQYDTEELPAISLELIKELEVRSLFFFKLNLDARTVQGIFRLSGDNNTILSYKEKIDKGKSYNLSDIQDIHVGKQQEN